MHAAQTGGDLQRTAASIRAFWKWFELRGQGRSDEARDAFALAVKEDPGNAYASLELGLQLAAEGDTASAAAALKTASELDSSYHDMLANLIGALENKEDHASNWQRSMLTGTACSLGRKDMEQAEQYLHQALELTRNLRRSRCWVTFDGTGPV